MTPTSLDRFANSNDSANSRDTPEERRRFPRLAVSREAFRLKPVGKLFALADLSFHGFSVRVTDENDLHAFMLGSEISGELGFRGERHRVRARVCHVERGFAGLEIVDITDEGRESLAQRLDPTLLGAELRLIPGSSLEQLWLHAINGADWSLELDSKAAIASFLVRLQGMFVRWSAASGRIESGTLGHMLPVDFDSGAVRMETWVLKPDPEADPAKMRIAIQLLSGCNDKQEFRDFCADQIRSRLLSVAAKGASAVPG
jgi:hypothetical protein